MAKHVSANTNEDRLIRSTADSNVVQTVEFLGIHQEMRVQIPSLLCDSSFHSTNWTITWIDGMNRLTA